MSAKADILLSRASLAFGEGATAVTALRDLDLHIASGEFHAVLGPSGCGKSSLISAIAGFRPLRSGSVLVGGRVVDRPGQDRGVVFQQPNLFPWKTVFQNIEFGLRMRGIARSDRQSAVRRILQRVGLSEFSRHYPSQLSGGMQQRVGLARVLVNRPDVLLMDEPFCSLDAQTRLVMQDLLLEVWEEDAMTVLFVTHDVEEAIYLGTRVSVLTRRPGRIRLTIPVNLPRPRTHAMLALPAFTGLKSEILDIVRSEASPGLNRAPAPGPQAFPAVPLLQPHTL